VEPFAGHQCYTVFNLFWGFDARRVHPDSWDSTAFSTPLRLLRLTSMPMGYTNSPAEFQKCMTFILRDEIPDVANIFIDDLPVSCCCCWSQMVLTHKIAFHPLKVVIGSRDQSLFTQMPMESQRHYQRIQGLEDLFGSMLRM
jgi:hypothetical protein